MHTPLGSSVYVSTVAHRPCPTPVTSTGAVLLQALPVLQASAGFGHEVCLGWSLVHYIWLTRNLRDTSVVVCRKPGSILTARAVWHQ
jgi:hypothetical protein